MRLIDAQCLRGVIATMGVCLTACVGEIAPVEPQSLDAAVAGQAESLISDQPHGGVPGFYFLPPIAPTASYAGKFEARLAPEVQLKQLDANGQPGALVVRYASDRDTKDARVRRKVDSGFYVVRLKSSRVQLDPAVNYRAEVYVGGTKLLGYVDIDVVKTAKEAKQVDKTRFAALVQGDVLPIRFRIEKQAVDQDGDGAFDWLDNCPTVPNPPVRVPSESPQPARQVPRDCDPNVRECDPGEVNCNPITRFEQPDSDHDGIGDACDCPSGTTAAASGKCEANAHPVSSSSGVSHTCAIMSSGALYCWGDNFYGQLGDGTQTGRSTPLRVGTDSDWTQLSVGSDHTCGIRTGGKLYCWGSNTHGQLGDGTQGIRTTLVQVMPERTWDAVSAGESHNCALSGADLFCWGSNDAGQVGEASLADQWSPVQVPGSWSQISAGARHSCALRGTDAYCWGDNQYSQLGSAGGASAAPRLVSGNYNSVSAGGHRSCGLQGSDAYCWGATDVSLSDGSIMVAETPQLIAGGRSWSAVSTGDFTACGRTTAGELYCWGLNDVGELGNGNTTDSSVPVLVQGGPWSNVELGWYHACAVSGERLSCWGYNDQGQLGLGSVDTGAHSTPAAVQFP